MQKYVYNEKDPVSGISYREEGTGEFVTKVLLPGKIITLPEKDEQVKRLIALGHLKKSGGKK